ncbi:MarR family winged helix-turn-helix transcriptional regulator [Ligilactobacillus cholophilus]|uniref:MarR family winged helix-turn-helix transcriptional regulator n=1 Tax=Ligilactobacillus cholophilus TaxID=3050131 RepID=UPI0025B11ACB|nr:MarR family winged helix-turn-helix transcriptional regulator [Ligilactobacillus cholophilus]
MLSLQKTMIDLLQKVQLHNHLNQYKEFEKLGAIDVYYLEAINQSKNTTIGQVSRLLNQSTPNTNYHIKKLMNLGLIDKKMDEKDRRVFHLSVTDKYTQMIDNNAEFWQALQDNLEEKVSVSDMATFKGVLQKCLDVIDENNVD